MTSVPLSVRAARGVLPAAEVVTVFSDGRTLPLPKALARQTRGHFAQIGFKGEAGQMHAEVLPERPRRALCIVGTGGPECAGDTFRRGVAAGIQYAKREGRRTVAVVQPSRISLSPFEIGRVFAEGVLLANYRFTAYQAEAARQEQARKLQAVTLFVLRAGLQQADAGVARAQTDVAGTILARDLVNEPASRLTPSALVEQARAVVRASRDAVSLTVWDRRQCEEHGMRAFLAVAQGSAAEPMFLHLVYRPGERAQGTVRSGQGRRAGPVVLIGKGITFDAGGLSLKPAEGMETMKIDMAGAAAVLGALQALPRLRFPLEVHGMIAACENMPSGTAAKPGDIVRTVSGKTVEILNTDAEGRLTLADVLGIAVKLKPRSILDLATLTGACAVALGEEVAGLFSNNDALADAMRSAAEAAGEPIWLLPLVREYRSFLKSEVADLKNVTQKRWGGAITAALFLQEFVGETPWAHLDIAGPSYAEKQTNPLLPVGGTGFGVRTILRYLESVASS